MIERAKDASRGAEDPGDAKVIAPTNRITVAFPFSKISLPGAGDDVADLAELVRDMADLLAKASPSVKAESIRKRAHALAARSA